MSRIKDILLMIGGALSVFFYALLKVKDKQIEKQAREIELKDQKIEEKEFINHENDKTAINKSDASNMSDDDIRRVYEREGWFRD